MACNGVWLSPQHVWTYDGLHDRLFAHRTLQSATSMSLCAMHQNVVCFGCREHASPVQQVLLLIWVTKSLGNVIEDNALHARQQVPPSWFTHADLSYQHDAAAQLPTCI